MLNIPGQICQQPVPGGDQAWAADGDLPDGDQHRHVAPQHPGDQQDGLPPHPGK